jgi:hypothetical protein
MHENLHLEFGMESIMLLGVARYGSLNQMGTVMHY